MSWKQPCRETSSSAGLVNRWVGNCWVPSDKSTAGMKRKLRQNIWLCGSAEDYSNITINATSAKKTLGTLDVLIVSPFCFSYFLSPAAVGLCQWKPLRASFSRCSSLTASLPHSKQSPFFFVNRGWKHYWIQELIVVLYAARDEEDRFMKWTISNGIIFPQWGTPFINHGRALGKESICYSCYILFLHPPPRVLGMQENLLFEFFFLP